MLGAPVLYRAGRDAAAGPASSVAGGVFLDLFGGAGGVGRAVRALGVNAVLLDLVYGYDVLEPTNKRELLRYIDQRGTRRHPLLGVCIAAPCESFSAARRAPPWSRYPRALRSKQHAAGLPHLTGADLATCRAGNQLANLAAMVIRACDKAGVPWMLENPKSSYIWLYPPLAAATRDARFSSFDQCQYGSSWRKPTTVAMSVPLEGGPFLQRTCCGQHGLCSRTGARHYVLSGSAGGNFKTHAAREYARPLCEAIKNTFRAGWASMHIASGAELLSGMQAKR